LPGYNLWLTARNGKEDRENVRSSRYSFIIRDIRDSVNNITQVAKVEYKRKYLLPVAADVGGSIRQKKM
jgi:hypothetical protein